MAKIARYRVTLPRHSSYRDVSSLREAFRLARAEIRDGWTESRVTRLSDDRLMADAQPTDGTYRGLRIWPEQPTGSSTSERCPVCKGPADFFPLLGLICKGAWWRARTLAPLPPRETEPFRELDFEAACAFAARELGTDHIEVGEVGESERYECDRTLMPQPKVWRAKATRGGQ
jgi:hypothetical protein